MGTMNCNDIHRFVHQSHPNTLYTIRPPTGGRCKEDNRWPVQGRQQAASAKRTTGIGHHPLHVSVDSQTFASNISFHTVTERGHRHKMAGQAHGTMTAARAKRQIKSMYTYELLLSQRVIFPLINKRDKFLLAKADNHNF